MSENTQELANRIRILERRERTSHKFWMQAAKEALEGDMRRLRNRVEMFEAEPVDVVLSASWEPHP